MPISVVESGTATFTVTVSPAVIAGDTVTVNYSSAGVTATEGTDFTSVDGGTLTFTDAVPGPQTIDVATATDSDVEAHETFTVDLSSSSAITPTPIASSSGTGTIQDDDEYTISVNDVTISEGDGAAVFTVSLDQPVAPDDWVRVEYKTADGTAKKGAADLDYTETAGILQFNPGENTKTVSVPVNDDSRVEIAENFFVNLSNDQSEDHVTNISDSQGECTINDNDKATVSINDVVVDETAGKAEFFVSIDVIADYDITFDYATSDGSASAGLDYVTATGSNKIDKDKLTRKIDVSINDDALVELPETFFLTISNLSPIAVFGDDQGQCTITSDDTFGVTVGDASGAEGSAVTFTVTLNNDITVDVDVTYDASDGTATVGDSDYTDLPGSVTFLAGSLAGATKTFTVDTTPDTKVEADETFSVTVSTSTGSR
jgi:hypothetical protein